MTICSFIEKKGKVLPPPRRFGERKRGVSRTIWKKKTTGTFRFRSQANTYARKGEDYFFSSFFGLHFSQVLPSFLAFTQQAWAQSLPAALALSQQDSALAKEMLPRRTTAAKIALMDFILFTFHCRLTRAAFVFVD
jgi:hypothetical protein